MPPATQKNTVTLTSDYWCISLQPSMGLQTLSASAYNGSQWHDIMPDCRSPDSIVGAVSAPSQSALAAACFHMLPYSNRIRDGKFRFNGELHQLDNAARHAIHGALRKRPWRTQLQDTRGIRCVYDTTIDGDVNWPWPICASVDYALDDKVFSSSMKLRNNGDSPMPAGLGWHPYFNRMLAGQGPNLCFNATGVYPDTDGDCLPVGAATDIPSELDFSRCRALDPAQHIDHCFAGFTGLATVSWPAANLSMRMQTSELCQHIVLYNPQAPYFALEPVSNANDGFNLSERGISAGVTVLAPGETMQASMSLSIQG